MSFSRRARSCRSRRHRGSAEAPADDAEFGLRLADFIERLRFARGELHFDADYIRGRRIIVYAHDADAGVKRDRAIEKLRQLWGTDTGRLSIQVLQEFHTST